MSAKGYASTVPVVVTTMPGMTLSEVELAAVHLSVQLGKPLGDEGWVESIARRLNLEFTMRPRGRQRVRFHKDDIKEA